MHPLTVPKRLHEKSEDGSSTLDSSQSSEQSVRLKPLGVELSGSRRNSRECSPFPRDRDIRDPCKKRHLHDRDGGTASSSASTCSEDSEMRVDDFLGNCFSKVLLN